MGKKGASQGVRRFSIRPLREDTDGDFMYYSVYQELILRAWNSGASAGRKSGIKEERRRGRVIMDAAPKRLKKPRQAT